MSEQKAASTRKINKIQSTCKVDELTDKAEDKKMEQQAKAEKKEENKVKRAENVHKGKVAIKALLRSIRDSGIRVIDGLTATSLKAAATIICNTLKWKVGDTLKNKSDSLRILQDAYNKDNDLTVLSEYVSDQMNEDDEEEGEEEGKLNEDSDGEDGDGEEDPDVKEITSSTESMSFQPQSARPETTYQQSQIVLRRLIREKLLESTSTSSSSSSGQNSSFSAGNSGDAMQIQPDSPATKEKRTQFLQMIMADRKQHTEEQPQKKQKACMQVEAAAKQQALMALPMLYDPKDIAVTQEIAYKGSNVHANIKRLSWKLVPR